jgi:CRP-like cAMP-binding protein
MDVFARATALARCTVLDGVPPAALLAIAERAAAVRLGEGEALPLRTDAGDAVLVIASGRVSAGGGELGPGALVGEVAALDDDAPVPAATALESTEVLRIFRDDFLDLLAEHGAAARALARVLARRIRGARAR